MFVSFNVIGSHIRDARRAKGLTQEKLAERLEMSALHYGRLERGERPASLEQIAGIAGALEVSTLSLLSGSFLREPLFDMPTMESLTFSGRLSRIAAGCTQQELEVLEEIYQTFLRQSKRAVS